MVLISYGPEAGKLATIIDIVDQNKCLVEGPEETTGVARQVVSFRHVALTDLTVKILILLIVYQNLLFLKVLKAFVWEKMIFA